MCLVLVRKGDLDLLILWVGGCLPIPTAGLVRGDHWCEHVAGSIGYNFVTECSFHATYGTATVLHAENKSLGQEYPFSKPVGIPEHGCHSHSCFCVDHLAAVCAVLFHVGFTHCGYNCLIAQIREEEKAIKLQSFLFGGQSRKGKNNGSTESQTFCFPSIDICFWTWSLIERFMYSVA